MTSEPSKPKKSRIVALTGIMLILMGIPAIAAGTYFHVKNGETINGYTWSENARASTDTYAYAMGPQGWDSTNIWDNIMARSFQWEAESQSGKELFLSIAQADAGYNYLRSIKCEVPSNWSYNYHLYSSKITLPETPTPSGGLNTPSKPYGEETLWLTSNTGFSTSVTWTPENGKFYLFIMNADGSPGVEADIRLGYRIGMLSWLPYLLITLGGLFCVLGTLVFRRR